MTFSTTQFKDIDPVAPEMETLGLLTEGFMVGLQAANSLEECRPFLRHWDEVRNSVESYGAMVELHFYQDTTNADYKAAQDAWDKKKPRWTELEVQLKRLLLAHPLRKELEKELGAQAFALWESEALAFDSALKEDLTTESGLEANFTELHASAEIEFQGETYNLSTITKVTQDADRDVRHGAESAMWDWYAAHGHVYDDLFDSMVKLRHGMARKLGMQDFVEMGYRRMSRVDYDRADVERFRASIVADVVPLANELMTRKAGALGVDQVMAWDEVVHDKLGNPKPQGDRAWMVDRARDMFDKMGCGLDEFFKLMADGGFLDLDVRKGKSGGGFCTAFPTEGMPFIFANFNGTKGDVEVLTHEIGHAFQCFNSRELYPCDYHWPTYESCEVHSMGLEFLTYPEMERFFGDEADRFRRVHMTEAITFLPYGAAVDHFQHLIYSKPDASPAERHDMWLEMERTYMPWRQWGDLAYARKGGRWQRQSHIYTSPFYYIDYVLAQTCALQLWDAAEQDRAAAMR
ncbi:MAG: M3 family oligoendopeptidase, partial [Planctomycetota bacterium]